MCLSHEPPADEPGPARPTRRGVLAGLGVALSTAVLPTRSATAATSGEAAVPGARRAVTSAMHVHGTWSEGTSSWRQQFTRAAEQGVDVLWMTDHDHRALATGHLEDLTGVAVHESVTGRVSSASAVNDEGSLRLRVLAADQAPASVALTVDPTTARLDLRAAIGGTWLHVTLGACRLESGATAELVLTLSDHPAYGSVPAGTYGLRYCWAAGSPHTRERTGPDGLTGLVRLPLPAAGSTVQLDPTSDIAALWPYLLPADNALVQLGAVATSPGRAVPAEATFARVRIERTAATEQRVVRAQRELVAAYRPDFPGLSVHPSVEVSDGTLGVPHLNVFGAPQRFVGKGGKTAAELVELHAALVAAARDAGGTASWNHPFGADHDGALPYEQMQQERRSTFSELWRNELLGAELLEVAYTVRGGHDLASHLSLWDTFSRRCHPLTGTGVNDDHDGRRWSSLSNGFVTGIWADSRREDDLVSALRAGQAYTLHPARWPGGTLDLRVGRAPMGSVLVRAPGAQQAAVTLTDLPVRSTVELVTGLVDYAGVEPVTQLQTRPAQTLGRGASGTVTGPMTFGIDTSRSCFVRAQVRLPDGRLAGTSNPVWLLRETPPRPVPAPRQVR